MSAHQEVHRSVLLPSAKITLFVKDETIRKEAETLRSDWRFARVVLDIVDGDVESAISYYEKNPSPDLVFVETLKIEDGFAERLEALGGYCSESTAAVVIGPVNDVYLYRRLIDLGVSDYLVKPLSAEVLAQVITKVLLERLGAEDSRLVAVLGAKGGVGASSVAEVIAGYASQQVQKKTILLDAAGGWSYLGVALGVEPVTTLHEVVRAAHSSDKDSFNRMIVQVDSKLSFLGTGAEPLLDDPVGGDGFEAVLNRLMQTYPVVVVDLSQAPVHLLRTVCSRANDVVLVTTATVASLRATRSLLQEVKTLRGGNERGVHIVLNKKGTGSGAEVSDSDIGEALKFKPALTLPFVPKIFGTAEAQGKRIDSVAGGDEILKAVGKFVQQGLKISSETSGEAVALEASKSGLLQGFLGKIKKN